MDIVKKLIDIQAVFPQMVVMKNNQSGMVGIIRETQN
jgi:hypothetical protein